MPRRTLDNIFHLGVKELRSLWHDRMMLILILWAFTLGVVSAANALPETLQRAAIAIVDEDRSTLSHRIADAFYPPYFVPPAIVDHDAADKGLDQGQFTFVLDIPPDFEKDVLAGRQPDVQLNIDATRMSQAFTGGGYVQQIVQGQVAEYAARVRRQDVPAIDLALRARFNPSLVQSWFEAVMQVINNVTMLSLVLTGAALIREREHGTVEHLLVMPVTPFEIMVSKVWSMGLVVVAACALSVTLVVQGYMAVPVSGSVPLFLLGATTLLFATTSMGIFLGTIARSMPQFGLLMMMVLMPLQLLSGGATPRENMPEIIQTIMLVAPTTHFVQMAQAVLFRGAGIGTVWPQILALIGIGAAFFLLTLRRFRLIIGQLA